MTVGTGVLASPGAVAVSAPASVAGAMSAATAEAHLPLDAEIVSTGDTGYLTSRKDDAGTAVLEWHTYADGSVVPVGTGAVGHDSNSDVVVTSDGAGAVSLRDMTPGADWSASFDLVSELGAGAKLVGVVGRNLFVTVPTTADYHELWQLTRVDGATAKTRRASGPYSQNFKVVASTASHALILTSNRVFPSSSTFRTEFWSELLGLSGPNGSREVTGAWGPASTGAYTADYRAWSEYAGGVTRLVVSGQSMMRRYDMDSSMSGAVIAGIAGNTLLYGVPGKAADEKPSPLYARSVTTPDAAPYKLLEHFSSVAHAPDGGLLVRGATADTDGLFRIFDETDGIPRVTPVAETGRVLAVKLTESEVPATVSLEKPGTTVPMEWALSRANVTADLTLTHTATGKKLAKRLSAPASGSRFAFAWDGVLDGISAPNGAYTWQFTATPDDGVGAPATASGSLTVSRSANPHDFNDNGSTDVLARDASGGLWRDDLFDWPSGGQATSAKRTKVASGWQIYDQVEAAGNLGGLPVGDLVARDTSGVLWMYLGKGDGTFASRVKVGAGWQIYNKITGGSDLNGDGRPDLLATDTAGVLWLYKGTGAKAAPFATRAKVGAGWQIYNQITAVGNIAGSAAGDLVARDTAGVLWLYQGNGTGGFATRVRIGAGWNGFAHLVGAGDVTADGRPDLIAYGPNGTSVYRSTGSTTAPFSKQTTGLYAGEGGKFNTIA
ncbi:FG-GAP repeat domain-containing protein [Streptomyces sp. NBC_00239]|uniref:FG-GAP repeat domain-containing protein n=1 Tax=Streptomyces sp. NBC_00239 TaxID=2903640 RepID=UPI002E2C2710|nr:VCBS repeat-containing protein [Streptomyces sp. NBC_00239]